MNKSRRDFIKTAGISALGIGAATLLEVTGASLANAQETPRYAPNPDALTAKHWGMVIDTKAFENPEDYQACIDACHRYHNVPAIGGKHAVRWLWTDSYSHVFPYHNNPHISQAVEKRQFLLLCNHCENPPCVRVCPTKATYKREEGGIVIMDMHRCIGCRFCMAACPFGARSFNFKDPRGSLEYENLDYPTRMKGVVEKCNFCAERLAKGQMPLCVEASEGKILFGDLDDPKSDVRKALRENFTIRRKPALGTEPSVYYIL